MGGGISGLATAWQLRQRPDPPLVHVLEESTQPGGTARTIRKEGFLLETGPNGFLDNKPSTFELCVALGMERDLRRADPAAARRFLFRGDRLRELPLSPGAFLRSDLLSLSGRVRVLFERFLPPKRDEKDESIESFGLRRIGREATDVLLDALVTGIHAGDPSLLSLPACFPRIAELERTYGSLIKAQIELAHERRAAAPSKEGAMKAGPAGPGGSLLAPAAGVGAMTTRLAESLGTAFLPGAAVRQIERRPDRRWDVLETGSERRQADVVVLACPAPQQAAILAAVDETLAKEISGIPYASAIVCAVGYRRGELPADMNGFGYLTPERLGRPVLGVQWSSAIFPHQAPEGMFQLRAILGGWRRADVVDWSDDAIVDAVRDDLRLTLGITSPPRFHWIQRWPRAIPQYHVGHLERVRRIEAALRRHPGLFLTGNAFRGVALNDCTLDAVRTADAVADYLRAAVSVVA